MPSRTLSVAFLVDSVNFSRATVNGETSLGGSESACIGLARALQARGHDVHVFATKLATDASGPDAAGVTWHPAEHFAVTNAWIEWDVVVALRQYAWFAAPVQARLRLLWNQDLLMPGVGSAIMSVAWQLDKLVYVSEYHRRQWEDQQPELTPIGWVTKNGFDASLVPDNVEKDPNRIIHITRPERGLAPLLAMWPELRKQMPEATLHICRYTSMYDSEGSNVKAMCEHFDREVDRVNAEVGGITYLGGLGKAALYRAIAESAVMWYPGVETFAETSCIAAIEAQANGTPFVGSWKGALAETVPSGVLIKGDAMTPEYQRQSIKAVVDLLKDGARSGFGYRKMQIAGRQHVQGYTYAAIAAEWEAQIEAWFAERYEANKPAILKQLLHEDDHCTAKHVAADISASCPGCDKNDGLRRTHEDAVEAIKFCDRVIAGKEQGAEDYAAHAIQDPLAEIEASDRFRAVYPRFKDCASVLDAACGNGAFAIGLALQHPTIHVHGLDYAKGNIERARDAAQRAGVADRVTFECAAIYDFDAQQMHADWEAFRLSCVVDSLGSRGEFDGLFVGEFAEHVANVGLLVDSLESVLSEGATVVYTCPSGPFGELIQRGMVIQRGHVHAFRQDDIKAVWGAKRDAGADYMDIGITRRGNPIGHWIIRYTKDKTKKAGERNYAVRAMRTRPKRTLSVGIIAKDAELDLARCLDSVWAIADEIVVGDTGSQDKTVAIAQSFGAKVIDLPRVQDIHEGFAGARNAVLDACTSDWFLWIDADEVLMDPFKVRPYLDGSIFSGFVIHQKHLFQDQAPTHDIPVRIFRRRPDIRFYGCVHEQPQQGGPNGDVFPALEPDLELLHTGYLTHATREDKRVNRNLPLIQRDQMVFPERELGKVILLREVVLQADARRAAAGGRVTPSVQYGYEQAIRLFQRFADPAHKYHQLARPWYESALKGAGIGYEMELAMAGKPAAVGGLRERHARPERVWVRDAAEFERLVAFQAQQIRAKMEPTTTVKTNPDLSVPMPEYEAAAV